MKPSRVEPAWLAETARGDAFGLRQIRDQSQKLSNSDRIDPIGRLTSVRDWGTNGGVHEVEYTYKWPMPTTDPHERFAPIWHYTQYTIKVEHRDKGALDRPPKDLPQGRPFRLTDAMHAGAKMEWDSLYHRILYSLSKKNSIGRTVWDRWRSALKPSPEADRELLNRELGETPEETTRLMVSHIKGFVNAGKRSGGR